MMSSPANPDPAATDDGPSADVEAELDALHQLPLGEFVAARNVAAKLWKARDRAISDRIKAQPKPSVSAWVVNALWWQHRAAFASLLEAGDAMRQASGSAAGPSELEGISQLRRRALQNLARLAEAVLSEGGHRTSTAVMRKVLTSLEACAAHGTALPKPGPGRFAVDLTPPGFGLAAALGTLEPRPQPPASAPPSAGADPPAAPSAAQRLEARWAQQLEDARTKHQTRARVLDEARARADALTVERDTAAAAHVQTQQTLVDAQRADESARHLVTDLSSRAQRAETDRAVAKSDLEALEREVEALEQKLSGDDR